MLWHLLTGEYPPACGGVGDYTAALAEALTEAGDVVHVWAPPDAIEPDARVSVHRLPDVFGAASRDALAAAFERTPGTVLLQYVPNALGARGGNLAFCRWFARLRRRAADVRVMFHEPYFYFRWATPWAASNGLAVVQRLMARRLLAGASRVYFSTETWSRYLRAPHAVALPVPSSIPLAGSDTAIARMRDVALAGGAGPLVGHFGTYGAHVAAELDALLPALIARRPGIRLALLGAGSGAYVDRLAHESAQLAAQVWASDRLDPVDVAAALRACDLLVQPYPDGITTRRTSVMAGLKNGVATVSTAGALTERVWRDTGAVALAPAGDVAACVACVAGLLDDDPARASLAARGESTYAARFSMPHTVATLRDGAAS
jgi:glycosyltransferase involved in cell wall biosynthesis